jgi:hypothetical protein
VFGSWSAVVVAVHSKGVVAWLGLVSGGLAIALAVGLSKYAHVVGKTRRLLPRPFLDPYPIDAEQAACIACSAPIELPARKLAAVCPFCGAETYRLALAQLASSLETRRDLDEVARYVADAWRAAYDALRWHARVIGVLMVGGLALAAVVALA